MKTCPRCGESQKSAEFTKNRSTSDGLSVYCRTCNKGLCSDRYYGRVVQRRECRQCGSSITRVRKYICNECAPEESYQTDSQRIYSYGVDRPMWNAMYFEQDGQCAIPGCETEAAVVDHCHVSGRVRALLCQPCNKGLGCFRDSSRLLAGALDYLAE